MWRDTRVTKTLGIEFPIIQGPFGGGLSSVALTSAVSNCGGLGSFGAVDLTPTEIKQTIQEIAQHTIKPFSINLWISKSDDYGLNPSEEQFSKALTALLPFYDELNIAPPTYAEINHSNRSTFEAQFEAILEMRPPVFSFIYGAPTTDVIHACHKRGIKTVGTATTVDEALLLEERGVDLIVASGFEAGGHRSSFLRPAEECLTGSFSLIPLIADAVRVPVIAAGGIADSRGLKAAFALGAEGVQIGTGFLLCDESGASELHRKLLLTTPSHQTGLTRSFTGRLARGLRNKLLDAPTNPAWAHLPYPSQSLLLQRLKQEALKRNRSEYLSLWAGQSHPLLRHRKAELYFNELVGSM